MDMSTHTATRPHQRPSGSPAGGQFAPVDRGESDVDLLVAEPDFGSGLGALEHPPTVPPARVPDNTDWRPSDSDFGETGAPMPRYAAGTQLGLDA